MACLERDEIVDYHKQFNGQENHEELYDEIYRVSSPTPSQQETDESRNNSHEKQSN